jgi:hypothetical protein
MVPEQDIVLNRKGNGGTPKNKQKLSQQVNTTLFMAHINTLM